MKKMLKMAGWKNRWMLGPFRNNCHLPSHSNQGPAPSQTPILLIALQALPIPLPPNLIQGSPSIHSLDLIISGPPSVPQCLSLPPCPPCSVYTVTHHGLRGRSNSHPPKWCHPSKPLPCWSLCSSVPLPTPNQSQIPDLPNPFLRDLFFSSFCTFFLTLLQVYLRDIVGSGPDHSNKAGHNLFAGVGPCLNIIKMQYLGSAIK